MPSFIYMTRHLPGSKEVSVYTIPPSCTRVMFSFFLGLSYLFSGLWLSPAFAETQCVAHRGYHQGNKKATPKNSLAAFKAAIRERMHGMEFDVSFTKDGTDLILHGPKLGSTGTVMSAPGQQCPLGANVLTVTHKEIRKKGRLLNGKHIPTLQDFMSAWKAEPYGVVVVEFKNRPLGCQFVSGQPGAKPCKPLDLAFRRIVKVASGRSELFRFISFDHTLLHEAKVRTAAQAKKLKLPWSPIRRWGLSWNLAQFQSSLAFEGVDAVSMAPNAAAMIQSLQARGKEVVVWTLNRSSDMGAVAGDVDWITTDNPKQCMRQFATQQRDFLIHVQLKGGGVHNRTAGQGQLQAGVIARSDRWGAMSYLSLLHEPDWSSPVFLLEADGFVRFVLSQPYHITLTLQAGLGGLMTGERSDTVSTRLRRSMPGKLMYALANINTLGLQGTIGLGFRFPIVAWELAVGLDGALGNPMLLLRAFSRLQLPLAFGVSFAASYYGSFILLPPAGLNPDHQHHVQLELGWDKRWLGLAFVAIVPIEANPTATLLGRLQFRF